MRLLTEYMRHEHKEEGESCDPSTMSGYRYLVLGEAKKLKKEAGAQGRDDRDVAEETENIRRLLLALKERDKEILTLEKIWNSDVALSQDMKDLCLSFALYKLLRRRFFNLGIHEAKLGKTRRLVLEGILGKCNPERAFQVISAEVSFLNDFFNSRHSIIFAKGFPFVRLVLSTVLIGGVAGMAYAVRVFSKVAKDDELGGVHHGVIFTWILVSLLGGKEIWEIITCVCSDWTKILVLCKYVENPWWFRGPMAKALVRALCWASVWPRWHGNVGQCNLLFPTSFLRRNRRSSYSVRLSDEVKHSVVNRLSRCLGSQQLKNYLDEAFSHWSNAPENLRTQVKAAVEGVDDDVHILLVWHIATCYCEIELAERRAIKVGRLSSGQPFSRRRKPLEIISVSDHLWSPYMIARTLSQYCAYALTLSCPLVPGNSLMANSMLRKVQAEKTDLFYRKLDAPYHPCDSSTNMLERLTGYASGEIRLDVSEEGDNTILKKGAALGKMLTEETGNDPEAVWKFLSEFWSGFVIYLAASTKASQHKLYLSTGGELMTHLWAMLSHAGILGMVDHGDQFLDTALFQGPDYDNTMQN